MRTFLYFSSKARTSGNFDDLMKAGRMDIVCHAIINAFFVSHAVRDNVALHLVFYGAPDPPKHIEIIYNSELDISKKDVSGLIKRSLYKYKPGKKIEAFPGCFIEKKSFFDVLSELQEQGKTVFILDSRGEDIKNIKAEDLEDAVFVLGDQEGLPKKELKRLKKKERIISLGKVTYFASQTVTIVNHELDLKGI